MLNRNGKLDLCLVSHFLLVGNYSREIESDEPSMSITPHQR